MPNELELQLKFSEEIILFFCQTLSFYIRAVFPHQVKELLSFGLTVFERF